MTCCASPPSSLFCAQACHEEDRAKTKQQLYRFLDWQKEVREGRAMLLEDLKAQARERGEDDAAVTLPSRCYVKYGRTTPDALASSAELKRTLIRAEAAAMRMSKGLTLMDLDAARALPMEAEEKDVPDLDDIDP